MNCHETLERFMSDAPNELAIDTETTGLTWADTAFMVSYCWESDDYRSGYIDLRTDPELWDRLKDYIEIVQPNLILHNAKFDFHKLGYYPTKFDDTCLMIYLLNEHHVKGLKPAAEKILGETTDEAEVLKAEFRKLKLRKSDGYGALPVDIVGPYAAKDAEFTLKLYGKLACAIEKIPSLVTVYNLEKQLILDVCDIEKAGLKIDIDYVENKIREKNDASVKHEQRIAELVNKPVGSEASEFNPRSPKQLLDIFTSMGYTVTSTGMDELSKIDHELAQKIVAMRQDDKLKSTYLEPMISEAVNGIVHPNFNLTRTVTKRFSSSGSSE